MNDKEALIETTEIEDSEPVDESESSVPGGSESAIPESTPSVGVSPEQSDTVSGAAAPAAGTGSGTVSKGDAAGSPVTVSKGDASESSGTVSKGDAAEGFETVSKGDAAGNSGTVSQGDVRINPASVVFTDGYDPVVFEELSWQLSDVSANQVLMLESMKRQELQNEACISILLIFLVVGVLRYIYKFFGMFFPVS
ncbi:MAG: hypothetical protein K2O32_15235 [Acetatifactor sp.]|nr:hypothetical protein [Acetatifactor sp.]